MGIAVDCIGMSYDDFCKCTFIEFESICKAWHEMTNGQNHESWERTRIAAAIVIQPHVKKKITPKQLLPLPWDKKTNKAQCKAPNLTAAERRKRFEELTHRLGDDINT